MSQPEPVPISVDECLALLDDLPRMTLDGQLEALERLIHVAEPGVRRRVLGLGAAIFSDERLIGYLRDEADDVRRNAGVEMLKLRRRRAVKLATALLDDPDPDVALQAVLVLQKLRDLRALEPLRRALRHPDSNVVQEAILALGELGHPRVVDDLLPLIDAEPWLASAAIETLGRVATGSVVPRLAARLADTMLGDFAADALARIGGAGAYEALARHWLSQPDASTSARMLARLTHVLERLSRTPADLPGFADALRAHVDDPDPDVRRRALECLRILRGQDSSHLAF